MSVVLHLIDKAVLFYFNQLDVQKILILPVFTLNNVLPIIFNKNSALNFSFIVLLAITK